MNCATVYSVLVFFTLAYLSAIRKRVYGGIVSCPSEARGNAKGIYFGYKSDCKECKCFTFHEFTPREHYNPAFRVNEQLTKLCASLYRNGFVYRLASNYDVSPDCKYSLAGDTYFPKMECYSGITITSVKRLDDVYYAWPDYHFHIWKYEWHYDVGNQITRMEGNRGFCEYKDAVLYGQYVHHYWSLFRSTKYNKGFNEGPLPKCSIVDVDSEGVHANAVIPCADLLKRDKVFMMCAHDAYADCVEKKVDRCSYVNRSGREGWFTFHYRIAFPPEEPFGRRCQKQDIFGEKCNATCYGSWTEWTEFNGTCLNGGVFISRRHQAMSRGDEASECNEDSIRCCHMEKEVAVDNCFDFDANLTMKLNSTSCKNGGKLVKDAAGYNMCQCASQYKGITCEEEACKDFCKNSGTCIARVAETLCICLPGFNGTNCENAIEVCGKGEQKCLNGGSCRRTTGNAGSYCECTAEYGGDYCEKKTEYCNDKSCSGAGVCHNVTQSHSFHCRCNLGRTGKNCEKMTEGFQYIADQFIKGESPFYIYLTIGIIVTLAVLTFFAGGTVVHRRRRRRRRRHGGADESMRSTTFASTVTSTLSRFSTFGGSKATSRMNTRTATKPTVAAKGKATKK